METMPRTLQYSPLKPVPLWLFDIMPRRECNLWSDVEKTFTSLSGLPVVLEEGHLSFSLARGETEWVFRYGGSLKKISLQKPGTEETIDIAAKLHALFSRLNGKEVAVETDCDHFKIFAKPQM